MTITEQTRQVATETTPPEDRADYLCRHVHADGRRCGSRALRRQNFCYYHTANRPPVQNPRLRKQECNEFTLADPTDLTSLQLTLGEVLRLIFANQIDPRRAGLLLYGLQIASGNLPKPQPELRPSSVVDVIEDPELGLIAPQEESAPSPWTDDEWRRKHMREALRLEINQKLVQECDARISELVKKHAQELSEQTGDLKYEVQCLKSVRDPHPSMRAWGEKGLEELRIKRENAAKQLADLGDGPDIESRIQELESIARSINDSANTSKSTAYEPRLPQHPRIQQFVSQRANSQPAESTAHSSATPPVESRADSDAELETKHFDPESQDEDDDKYPIIPYIDGSAGASAPQKNTAFVPRLPQHPRIQQIVSRRPYAQPPRKPVAKSTSAESATQDDQIAMSG